MGDPNEITEDAVLTPDALAPACAAGETEPATESGPDKEEIGAIVREAVAQTIAALGLTTNTAAQQHWLVLEKSVTQLSHLPDDVKTKLENVLGVFGDRLEDPKGLLVYNRQKRLFLDLLAFHDLIRDLEVSIDADGPDAEHRTNYQNLREQLLQLLAVNGVTLLVPEVGAPFNALENRVVRIAPAVDPAEDGNIDSVVRDGFAFGSYIVRPAQVVVRKRSAAGSQ